MRLALCRAMNQANPTHPETQLAATLEELLALGTATKHGQKDVSNFLKELKDFVSESSGEIASAYLKEALKQSLSQLAVEAGSKVAGLAIKHFTVILLTIFFEQTDRNLKSSQKWLFLSALNSGTASALQALHVVCRSPEDLDLRNHLLKTGITQLNEAHEMSRRDPRILLYVRLLQGLASEALGAHSFTRQYLSDCLPQFQERYLHFKSKSEECARKADENAGRAFEIRLLMAPDPSQWTHKWPETRGDLEVGFETLEEAIEHFNASSDIKYIENPLSLEKDVHNFTGWSEDYRRRMDFYQSLLELAEKP
jgi:hypothetical protein